VKIQEITQKSKRVLDRLSSTTEQFSIVYGMFDTLLADTENFSVSPDLLFDQDEISSIVSYINMIRTDLVNDKNPNLMNMISMCDRVLLYFKTFYE
jgi:hypothetical protein